MYQNFLSFQQYFLDVRIPIAHSGEFLEKNAVHTQILTGMEKLTKFNEGCA